MAAESRVSKPSAKAKAVDLLSRSDQSINRLTEKLRRKDYSPEEIEDAIDWLKEKHYIDDQAGCRRRFQYMYEDSSASVKQICAKLVQQGYPADVVRSCVPDDNFQRELSKASKALRIKFKKQAEYKKMMQYLYTRGYEYDAARTAVESYIEEFEEYDY